MFTTSCKKNDDGTGGGGNTGGTLSPDSVYVSLSQTSVEFNGFDYTTITVKDYQGNDVTSTSSIFANGSALSSNKFVPGATGTFYITAKKGTLPSGSKLLNVVGASASPFSKKIVVEDCTGAWCGYCPRVAYSLDEYKKTRPNCIVLAVHGGGGTDPFKYQYYTNFNSNFNVTGYPTAILNRRTTWNENNSELNSELAKYAPLGLSIESSVSGTNITGKAKVKFNVTTDQSMKIVVLLVENGLIANQVNYYAPTYGANPIVGFVHNGVIRKAATDIFGDAIPATAQVKNGIYEFPFSISAIGTTSAGTTFTADVSKCSIVAFVVDGSTAKKGAYNAQTALVGSTKAFD